MSKRIPYTFPEISPDAPLYWRSLEEKEKLHDPALYEARAAEFTPAQLALPEVSRRGFLGVVGSVLALAGAEGCRRPVEKILPYAKMPEEVIPGVPSHYATVQEFRGEAIGLVVESHEGRPTKVEGNPDHPASLGAVDAWAQASVLDLYDPDRSTSPLRAGHEATWEEFERELDTRLTKQEESGGETIRILLPPSCSPTLLRLRTALRARFPKAKLHTYTSVHDSHKREGARHAFGAPVHTHGAYDQARVILSIDSDILQTEPGHLRATRLFARGRTLRTPHDAMNRLYVVEPVLTTTGANADHRLRLPAGLTEEFTWALATALSTHSEVSFGPLQPALQGITPPAGVDPAFLSALAADLVEHRAASLVVAGSRQPPAVHALVHAINHALGNVGRTVRYSQVVDPEQGTFGEKSAESGPAGAVEEIRDLVTAMNAGKVDTLFLLGGNPVYDAPADLSFLEALKRVPCAVHLSDRVDETSAQCLWHLPRAHVFESWGDLQSTEGAWSVQQPLIAPLYASRSELELLALCAGIPDRKGYTLVRQTWATRTPALQATEGAWRRLLRDGLIQEPSSWVEPALRLEAIASLRRSSRPVVPPHAGSLEAVFLPCAKMLDGRYANNAWLQELPDPMTKIVWDNAALMSKKTADALGVQSGDTVRLHAGNNSIQIAVWVLPGMTEWVLGLPLGWGRTCAGRVGNGHGFDVHPLRTTAGMEFLSGVTLEKTGERYLFAQTQEHHSMEGRPLAREATYTRYQEAPNFAALQAPAPRSLPLWKKAEYTGHKWGMSIDLNACTGCNACVIACQAENNIAVVGKEQVAKGRELHWIRVDRYFLGEEEDPQVAHQPIACVQCEDAPCENVCPVNATAHSPEGLNDMAYNRCIGTRYCANNCPYKVRRFNYLDFKGEFWNGEVPETVKMVHNPNVTVRMRGVMEKCTYCVQRIQEGKIESKRTGTPLKDGDITPACAQTCPAEAIVFGDLNDPASRVSQLAKLDRRYGLLAELGTSPRTSYLAKVRNPNKKVPS